MNDRDRPVRELTSPGRWLRAPACRLGLLVWATLAYSSFARADQALLQAVSGAYEKHRQALTSLLVHYTEQTEYDLPTEKLASIGFIPVLPESVEITVCIKGKKYYYRSVAKKRDMDALLLELSREDPTIKSTDDAVKKVSVEGFRRRLSQRPLETEERIDVYDGSTLHEKAATPFVSPAGKRDTFSIRNPPPNELSAKVPETYCDWAFYGLEDPAAADKPTHVPKGFPALNFAALPNREKVDGADCVVLEAAGQQKIWLDPALGFAVRQRQLFHQGALALRVQFRDFAEALPGVWLPKQVDRDAFGTESMPRLPPADRGKKLLHIRNRVTRFETNDPSHDSLFVLTPKPGSMVANETIPPLDSDGKPLPSREGGVVYTQPADPAQLQQVMREAQLAAGGSLPKLQAEQRERSGHWLIWANVIFVTVAVALVVWSFLKRRARAQRS